MGKLTDSDPMPQGKFAGQQMENIPYWHLLWLVEQPFCRADVREYVKENWDVLEVERKRDTQNQSEDENANDSDKKSKKQY